MEQNLGLHQTTQIVNIFHGHLDNPLSGKTEKKSLQGKVFLLPRAKQFNSDCEIIWVKVNTVSAKSLFVAVF